MFILFVFGMFFSIIKQIKNNFGKYDLLNVHTPNFLPKITLNVKNSSKFPSPKSCYSLKNKKNISL